MGKLAVFVAVLAFVAVILHYLDPLIISRTKLLFRSSHWEHDLSEPIHPIVSLYYHGGGVASRIFNTVWRFICPLSQCCTTIGWVSRHAQWKLLCGSFGSTFWRTRHHKSQRLFLCVIDKKDEHVAHTVHGTSSQLRINRRSRYLTAVWFRQLPLFLVDACDRLANVGLIHLALHHLVCARERVAPAHVFKVRHALEALPHNGHHGVPGPKPFQAAQQLFALFNLVPVISRDIVVCNPGQ